MPVFNKYPRLYTDISSLTQINKTGYLARALQIKGLDQHMLYGSDWPLQFSPLISPWYHIRHISFTDAWRVGGIDNQWDRDVALKKAFKVPDAVFTRAASLPGMRYPGSGISWKNKNTQIPATPNLKQGLVSIIEMKTRKRSEGTSH